MPPSRNDPCPCGSGKKFKQCCGALKSAAGKTATRNPVMAALQQATRHHQAGRLKQAHALYLRALKELPDDTKLLELLGVVCCQQEQFQEGAAYFRRALASHPKDANLYYNLAKALKALGKLGEAAECYKKVLQLEPASAADASFNLANLYKDFNRFDEAIEYYHRALKIQPNHPDACNNLGIVLRELGRYKEAMECFNRALSLNPGHAESHNSLGVLHAIQGRLDEAIAAYKRALELKPDYPDALANLAQSEQYASQSQMTELEAKLNNPEIKREGRISLHFALGKVYNDSGRYDDAFAQYAQANRLRREELTALRITFNAETFVKEIDSLILTYSMELFARSLGKGCDSEVPVFVVGMPRSGTTLVEQIIASHSRAFGAGELDNLNDMTFTLAREKPGYPACIGDLKPARLEQLSQAYLVSVQALAPHAVRIVDKMPDNILHLGLVALLFPKARVIYCQRDPRDTCLSCYFQKFSNSLAFSNDLVDCAKRYLQIQRLLAHWESVLPLRILEIQYEKLVAEQEPETRKLLEFLDLDWEASCLEFYKVRREINTASVWQARKPLYSDSVERWRHYEKHLEPMMAVLDG
jgi:tetratricopeptide (TPR) repeat protein